VRVPRVDRASVRGSLRADAPRDKEPERPFDAVLLPFAVPFAFRLAQLPTGALLLRVPFEE